jgi:Primase C terminal 1 (PriCT-1).
MAKNMTEVYSLFLQGGIRKYKYKNSKIKPIDSKESTKLGAIFGFRTKELMIAGRGVILGSVEAVAENQDAFSHWTPNVYRYGTYVDDNRSIPSGHKESNLRQINTFVIDFDVPAGEKMGYQDILVAALDLGFMPTMILKSPGGYQAYFVLESPAYVTAKSNFKVVNVAKKISENLRNCFAKSLPVDLTCNHFGIARFPRQDTVVFYEPDYRYSFESWLNWSMKQSEYHVPAKKKWHLSLVPGKRKGQVSEKWFDLLLNSKKIEGTKNLKGRNNVIFTLSLAYFSSGYEKETCLYNMQEFNERLESPVGDRELIKIVNSAYSGEYAGARKSYVRLLIRNWVSESLSDDQLFSRGWYKFKKARDQRKNSHLEEWKEDLLAYLAENSYTYKPYLATTKKEIREDLKIPERTFDRLLKKLAAEGEVYFKIQRGRGGGITIASVKQLFLTVIQVKRDMQEAWYKAISGLFNLTGTRLKDSLRQLVNVEKYTVQLDLFGTDSS